MGYKTQKEAWLRGHPKATAAEAWEAGYVQCTENWCRKERFGIERRLNICETTKNEIDYGNEEETDREC